jgi:hypothetical protein
VSEYQYYEFQAVDRPLTQAEMRQLRAVSTRATITATRFVNFYTWGDFKGNPSKWMEKYFDAFLYGANWGTRQLSIRLPARLLDLATARLYCRGDAATTRSKGSSIILDFHGESEDSEGWDDDGSGWLSSLIPLRGDIASGDYRALYLAWLLCVQQGELEDDDAEPPLPPNLGKLTAPLKALADFLRLDPDLIAAAAERSSEQGAMPSLVKIGRWIAALPEAEKTGYLVKLATGDGIHLRAELLRRFQETQPAPDVRTGEPRTVAELLQGAAVRTDERRREEAERAVRENARREREQAEARNRALDGLAKREVEAWREVDLLIASKRPRAYDEAVGLMADLWEIGARGGRSSEVEARIQAIREEHARKPTFLQRLRKAGLR